MSRSWGGPTVDFIKESGQNSPGDVQRSPSLGANPIDITAKCTVLKTAEINPH